eukprot:2162506-Alexandrium_andersonii.AAC.1
MRGQAAAAQAQSAALLANAGAAAAPADPSAGGSGAAADDRLNALAGTGWPATSGTHSCTGSR